MPASNVVLQAIFEADDTPNPPQPTEFTVTFDANGGMPEVSSMETVNGRLSSLPGAIHSGRYRFAGWYTAKLWRRTRHDADRILGRHHRLRPLGSHRRLRRQRRLHQKRIRRRRTPLRSANSSTFRRVATLKTRLTGQSKTASPPAPTLPHFSPDDVCTRAQAVTFLWRAAGCPQPKTAPCPFTDVPEGSYFYRRGSLGSRSRNYEGHERHKIQPRRSLHQSPDCRLPLALGGFASGRRPQSVRRRCSQCLLRGRGFVGCRGGYHNGHIRTTFSPDDTCTRAQIVTFLWRCKK